MKYHQFNLVFFIILLIFKITTGCERYENHRGNKPKD